MNMNLLRNITSQLTKVNQQLNYNQIQIRTTSSFFTRLSASELWKSVTSVSNVGRKRGRQKAVRKRIDLNKGQIIGVGKQNLKLPGLNYKLVEGKQLATLKPLGKTENYEEKVLESRASNMRTRNFRYIHPLDRGWASTHLFGRSIGLPDHLSEELKDFDCKVLFQEAKPKMVKNAGRTREVTTYVIAGNKKGLVGFGEAATKDFRKSANWARYEALKQLRYIQLDGKTIMHDFTSSFHHTTIACFKMPPGFGVVGDKTIKSCCAVMGIEDLYVNVIRNAHRRKFVVNAFILGLTQQRTYQQIADEKGLNLVEMKEENDYLPKIIARPSNGKVRTTKEIDPLEIMDVRQYLFEGRVYDTTSAEKSQKWLQSLNYARYLQAWHKQRHAIKTRAQLRKRYGKVESMLTLREKEERLKKFGKLPELPEIVYRKEGTKP